ncbi:L,D-transpeptidase family protein [Kaarinaea lacus]
MLFILLIAATPLAIKAETNLPLLSQLLRQQLIKSVDLEEEADLIWLDLRTVYSHYNYRPIWFNQEGLSARAKHWIQKLKHTDKQALNPQDYNLCFIERHCKDKRPEQQVWVELLLTKALMHYSEQIYAGRIRPEEENIHWYIRPQEVNAVELVVSVLDTQDFEAGLEALHPPHAGYKRLRKALQRYSKLQQAGGWDSIPDGPSLQLWDKHEQVALLRRRLKIEGDLSAGYVGDPMLFDHNVELAVGKFQIRHGIDVDGIVGPATRATMNVPIEKRIEQIRLNMERWRWLPRDLGERYIMVNTAAYELVLYEHNQPLTVMRVIAGTPERPTPVVEGPLESIVLNPYWFIPRTIALQDILPRQKNNPKFLSSMNIRVFANTKNDTRELDPTHVDWSGVNENNFPYRFRQDPGPNNSLGQIKIKFENDFALYLHDTPKQNLFFQESRAFSSGCIRVENAIDLVHYLLQGEIEWPKEQIQAIIASGETVTIPVPEPIPLYLVYWTVWVGTDNAVLFRNDVYGWDQELAHCL